MRNTTKEILRNNKQISRSNAIYRKFSMKCSIPESELQILYCLSLSSNGSPIQEMIDFTNLPKQTINSALRNMEKKEWIVLEKINSKNKKAILTDKGKEVSNRTAQRILNLESEVFKSFPKNIVDEYLKFMDEYLDKLEEKTKEF